MSNIPKKIWAIWVNFTAKTDGQLTKELEYFKTRIESQHHPTGWEINIITSYRKLKEFIEEEHLLNQIVDNQYINPAHKSDAIRFFLLKKFGGFWIDLSTFLFVSLDIYLDKQPKAEFIGYFTPPFMVEEIMFEPLNKMMDSIKFNKLIEKFKPLQHEYIKLNNDYKNYPFMPENFFIASVQNGEIVADIYEMLITFWEKAIPNIRDNDSLCNEINILVNEYAKNIFDINYLDYNLTQIYDNEDMSNDNFIKYTLNRIWNCGYLFNYLQMYIAIVNYIKKNNLKITQEADVEKKPDNYNRYESDLCSKDDSFGEKINSCQNIIASSAAPESNKSLYLLSLSYNRMIKWGHSIEERISFDNAYIKERLDSINNKNDADQLIIDIIEMGIYQIKFSSWTRNSSIIQLLMLKYPNVSSTFGGKLKKKNIQKNIKIENIKNIQKI